MKGYVNIRCSNSYSLSLDWAFILERERASLVNYTDSLNLAFDEQSFKYADSLQEKSDSVV